jgi:energy-coupling factor transport system permease protein
VRVATGLGQYVPVASPVHALNARAKMALVAGLTIALFSVDGFEGLAVLAATVAATVGLSRVPWRVALRGLRMIALLLAFTLLAHALVWRGTNLLAALGPLGISGSGLVTGMFFATRIVVLVVGTSLLTLTTTPVDLTDALESLMKPLSLVGVPTHDIAMMLTIALRFIPTTAEEAERIVTAQSARGAKFDSGGPVARARAYVPVLVPLFVNLFRRADSLATAMEARCYRGGEGRTRLKDSRMRASDWLVALAGSAGLIVAGLVL